MDREIKFRAFDTKVKQPMWDHEECLSLLMLQGRVLNGTADDKGLLERFKIMQYTGLKDKNGKEMYEGDILEYSGPLKIYDKIKVVEWVDKSAFIGFLIARDIEYEILGNIYENPELIRKEGNKSDF